MSQVLCSTWPRKIRIAQCNSNPIIYIRMGEAGMMTLPFYRDQIMGKEIRAGSECFVLAVCRIGEADTDLIEEMKRRYNSVDFQGGEIRSTIRRHFL